MSPKLSKYFSHPFLFVVFIGIVIRLFFLLTTLPFGPNADLLRHIDWGTTAYTKGFAATYDVKNLSFGNSPNNLPPGTLYILSGSYVLSLQASKIALKVTNVPEGASNIVNFYLPRLFLKLPSFLADIIITLFLYLLVRKLTTDRRAVFASALFFLNPAVFYNSSIWGQIDSINCAFFIGSLFFLVSKRYFLSVLFAFFSLFIKLSLLPLLPFYFILLLNKMGIKKLGGYSLLSIIVLLVLSLPVSGNPAIWLIDLYIRSSGGELPHITVAAFNFWWAILDPFFRDMPYSSVFFLGFSLSVWAYVLFFAFSLPFFITLIKSKHKLKTEHFFLMLAVIWLLAFFFLPRMHERYLYPFLPLGALAVGIIGKYKWTYLALSLLHVLNLYFVWHPNLFLPFELLNTPLVFWLGSILTVIFGLYLYYQTLHFTQIKPPR